jgi:hypothetical protein
MRKTAMQTPPTDNLRAATIIAALLLGLAVSVVAAVHAPARPIAAPAYLMAGGVPGSYNPNEPGTEVDRALERSI